MINSTKLTLGAVAIGLSAAACYTARYFFYPPTPKEAAPKPLDTLGHFKYSTHPQHHQGAIQVVRKIFDRLVDPNANNGFDWIYLSQKEEIFKTLKADKGSCSGNCCALGKAIIKRGRVLTAAELQGIEADKKFPKRAMGFHLVQYLSNEVENRRHNARLLSESERPYPLTEEEKIILGDRKSCFAYVSFVQCLKTYDLSFLEVAHMPLEKFLTLWKLIRLEVPFEWAKQEFKMPNATAQELIDQLTKNFPDRFLLPNRQIKVRVTHTNTPELIYPKSTMAGTRNYKHLKSFSFYKVKMERSQLVKECPSIESPQFSGFFIIEGNFQEDGEPGHDVLLEVDNLKELYVLYDNNLDFYTGKNLEACLYRLQLLWEHYKYPYMRFHPYTFERPEIKA